MHILITGGTGFIGKALCKKLNAINKKPTIYILSRQVPEKVKTLCGENIHPLKSLNHEEVYFDVIVNLAGEAIADKRWSQRQKDRIIQSRISITHQIIQFIKHSDNKPSCLISGSAIGFYGDQGDVELTEDSPHVDEFTHRICQEWEQTAQQASDYGVRVCLLRTGLVIGKDGGFLQRMLLPFQLGLGGKIGSGQQWMSWVHLDDIVAMIIFLISNQQLTGIFNATAPNPVTNLEFSQSLAKQLHRPALLPLPAFALKLALGEMSHLLLTGQKVLPQKFMQAEFQHQYPNLSQALSATL